MKLFKNMSDKLFDAAKGGDLAEIRRLLQDGADVNAKDKNGYTPLHITAATGDKDAAELLITKGADVNGEGSVYMTPLGVAAMFDRVEVAELLIAKGADVNGKCSVGTPLDTAVQFGKKNIGMFLISQGASADNALLQASQSGEDNWDMIEWLISMGANVNGRHKDGTALLQKAICLNNKVLVELLKKHGAVE